VTRLRFLFFALLAIVAVAIVFACGEDPVTIPPPDTSADGATQDGAASDAPTNADGGTSDAADDSPDVVCPKATPDDATGVFVAAAGTTDATCGTRADPCKTIALGITRANAAGKAKVYVSRGVYVEHVVLTAGVRVEGGFDILADGSWNRTCVDPRTAVTLRAPTNSEVTVTANDLGGKAELAFVRVESKAQAMVASGDSLYGVVARGATTTLALEEVDIETGDAVAALGGKPGDAGADGAPTGCTPPSTGANGPNGDGGAGAAAGTFGASLYVESPGGNGTAGGTGQIGTTAGAAPCVQCGSCNGGCTFVANGPMQCGTDGLAGCPGEGGGMGGGGLGGGSSVGLYAFNATVTVKGGRIKAGDAGNGGAGGTGGTGGKGAAGTAGAQGLECTTSCSNATGTCVEIKSHAGPGTPGGNGGNGGNGGAGGGGAGGSSIAIFQGGAGIVTTDSATTLAVGKLGKGGGSGGSAGANGVSANRVP